MNHSQTHPGSRQRWMRPDVLLSVLCSLILCLSTMHAVVGGGETTVGYDSTIGDRFNHNQPTDTHPRHERSGDSGQVTLTQISAPAKIRSSDLVG